ncbi:sugar transferase [Cellulomonas sp. 179-A 9B4 NHS]|uniref:sugar transferase n=1 Tax=Cellulomonas sp. 179-A 9B4 NHS TaxID=3142379 RepID=UPI0039A3A04A
MTLTADRGEISSHDGSERRAPALGPRRSWASTEPFERRRTPFNDDEAARERAWRAVGLRHALVAAALDGATALVASAAVLGDGVAARERALVPVLAAVVFVMLVAACGGYRRGVLGDGPGEFQAVLRASGAAAVLAMAVAFAFGVAVPRPAVLVGLPVLALTACVARYALRRHLHRRRREGVGMRSTIVVGDAASARRVVEDLSATPHHGFRVDGVCLPSVQDAEVVAGVPVVGGVADVVQVAADLAGEVVIVTGSCLSGEALRRLSWALGRAGADLVVAPGIVEVSGPRLSVRPTVGLSLLEVEVDPPRRRMVAKTVLDVTLAALLGVAVLPVVLLAAAAVALTSPGHPFFRQTRIGIDGRPFTIWKLRTMHTDAEERLAALRDADEGAGVLFKMRADPRVTPVGRVLRRFSVDELPQLWNVVRGDMSLVGPRPPLAREVDAYEDEVHRRLAVKPGLTGLWQVSGRSDLAWDEAVRLDLRYADNWSVAMDLMILWKTGRAVLRGAGAY